MQNALYALRQTAEYENRMHDNITRHATDLVVDTIEIVETNGAPFVWAAYPNGSHIVSLTCPDVIDHIDAIEKNYHPDRWWVWDGVLYANKELHVYDCLLYGGNYTQLREYVAAQPAAVSE